MNIDIYLTVNSDTDRLKAKVNVIIFRLKHIHIIEAIDDNCLLYGQKSKSDLYQRNVSFSLTTFAVKYWLSP